MPLPVGGLMRETSESVIATLHQCIGALENGGGTGHVAASLKRLVDDLRNAPGVYHGSTLAHAVDLATRAHFGQERKGVDEPYILHPMRVMLSFSHESAVHRVVAILHDVPEDTEYRMGFMSDWWTGDPRVIPALDAITQRKYENESREAYLARVVQNDVAVSVKLADLKDNLRDPWWCPRGVAEKYATDLVALHAVAQERHLLIP